ncbi:MAG: hypothetical protein GF307_11005 [candidate division Zixibacteria bacterium]|nr:hypothetical protein [candidate division Zixibacteria bacterium]
MKRLAIFPIVVTAMIILSSCGGEPLTEITWHNDIDSALTMEQPVLVDFWSPG